MQDAMRLLPLWVTRGMLIMYVLHDLSFLTAAVLAAQVPPPTIEDALRVYVWVWILMVGSGAISGLIGTVTRNVRWEVLGCGLMIGGLIVYGMAIAIRASTGATSLAAAAILFGAAFAIGVRFFTMFAAIYLREGRHAE